eukprot:NODE_1895_length_1041_cov_244.169371.p1 GENE.NODE_1895_length_1041_cov_244.169371~~NODE_1895_length_1041_cov_244.169371.p1  ORF type:complete len:321 (+),score=48.71 NODE_1895_length_1041_cov_244.169371:102-965(+)
MPIRKKYRTRAAEWYRRSLRALAEGGEAPEPLRPGEGSELCEGRGGPCANAVLDKVFEATPTHDQMTPGGVPQDRARRPPSSLLCVLGPCATSSSRAILEHASSDSNLGKANGADLRWRSPSLTTQESRRSRKPDASAPSMKRCHSVGPTARCGGTAGSLVGQRPVKAFGGHDGSGRISFIPFLSGQKGGLKLLPDWDWQQLWLTEGARTADMLQTMSSGTMPGFGPDSPAPARVHKLSAAPAPATRSPSLEKAAPGPPPRREKAAPRSCEKVAPQAVLRALVTAAA